MNKNKNSKALKKAKAMPLMPAIDLCNTYDQCLATKNGIEFRSFFLLSSLND